MRNFIKQVYRIEVDGATTNSYCYDGFWELNDPSHPGGGSVTYVDINGNTDVFTDIWAGYPINIVAQSITQVTGAAICI